MSPIKMEEHQSFNNEIKPDLSRNSKEGSQQLNPMSCESAANTKSDDSKHSESIESQSQGLLQPSLPDGQHPSQRCSGLSFSSCATSYICVENNDNYDTQEAENRRRNDRNVVIMLLVVCCSYLIFTATAAFFNVLGHMCISKPFSLKDKMFVRSLAEVPAVMNNSLNFLFFYLSGSSFRQTFKRKFLRRRA